MARDNQSATTKTRGKENRRTRRVETSQGVWVAWRTDGDPTVSRVQDLSMGGVFISTSSPLTKGSTLQLLFSIPEGEVRVEAVVRYSDAANGMGVEFRKITAADRLRLQSMLARLTA